MKYTPKPPRLTLEEQERVQTWLDAFIHAPADQRPQDPEMDALTHKALRWYVHQQQQDPHQGSILSDDQIAALCEGPSPMIAPFVGGQVSQEGERRVISYGLTSYGYDARVAPEWQLCREPRPANPHAPIDPLQFDPASFEQVQTANLIIPPHGFALARTVERFKIPRDVLVLCVGKSTYARVGLIVNVTPLEPEWEGEVTLELSNTTPRPIMVRGNQGICQFIFHRAADVCRTSYKDKGGKYQDQRGITFAR